MSSIDRDPNQRRGNAREVKTKPISSAGNISSSDNIGLRGTVKWYNPGKGYGFILPAAGGADVFVHITAVQKANMPPLVEGQPLLYDLESNKKREHAGVCAVNLRAGQHN